MKNRVIKKIMAYLLVGAMVITTPMTASASELQKAYGVDQGGNEADDNANTGSGSGTDTNTDTNTNTNTNSGGIPSVPIEPGYPIIHKLLVSPTDLQFDVNGDEKSVEATVILDESELPKPEEVDDNEMSWTTENNKEELRKKLEESIRWYSEGFESLENPEKKEIVTLSGTEGKKIKVTSVFPGEGKIYAWIEADGKTSNEKNDRPTEGDYVAEVTVSVKKALKGITFNTALGDKSGRDVENFKAFDKFTWGKRQYDLRKFTILEYSDGTHDLASNSDIKLTYSISSTKTELKTDKITATLTDAGNLKISKGIAGGTIKVNIIGDDIMIKDAPISLITPNAVKTMGKINTIDKTKTLDFGGEIVGSITYPGVTNQDKEEGIEKSTDELIWSTNKPAIVEVKPIEKTLSHGDCTSAEIIAKGVGTAKVTVKSSSGKSAQYTVNVYSIPDSVEVIGVNTGYTGKPISLKAILKKGKKEIPVGTAKLTWSIDKLENKKNPNAKISGKKENATITPANLLVNEDKNHVTEASIAVRVKADYKYGSNKSTVEVEGPFNITLTQSNVSKVQIDMYRTVLDNNGELKRDILASMEPVNKSNKETYAITYNGLKNNEQFDVGQKYDLEAISKDPDSKNKMDTIAWAVTGKGITYSEILGSENEFSQIIPNFTSNAKATFKASYITLTPASKEGKNPTAKKNTKTINITPVKKADSIAFAKPVIVKNPAKDPKKPQEVSFTITESPKKSYYGKVEWKVLAYNNKDQKTYTYNVKMDNAIENLELVKPTKKPNYKSVTVKVPGDFTTGSVIKVGAYSEFGVVAYGYIYITEQTKKVIPYVQVGAGESQPVEKMDKKQVTMSLFDENGKINTAQLSAKFDTQVNVVGTDNKVTVSKKTGEAAGQPTPDVNLGDTKSYITDPITYSLDKKSALVVKIDEDGKVIPLKRGKATVTIKALNGKSAKVKIEVN